MSAFWDGFEKMASSDKASTGYVLPTALVLGGGTALGGSIRGLRKLDKHNERVNNAVQGGRHWLQTSEDNLHRSKNILKYEKGNPVFLKMHRNIEDRANRYKKYVSKLEGVSKKLKFKNNLLGTLGIAGTASLLGGVYHGYKNYKTNKRDNNE